ncbi:hypothetical protein FQZ97_898390 [compost metagenome]
MADMGARAPWPWPLFFSATGAAAALGAGGGACFSGGAGQVMAPSLITVRPRIASSSMLTIASPSLALHNSSVRRSRLVAYNVDDCLARREARSV